MVAVITENVPAKFHLKIVVSSVIMASFYFTLFPAHQSYCYNPFGDAIRPTDQKVANISESLSGKWFLISKDISAFKTYLECLAKVTNEISINI